MKKLTICIISLLLLSMTTVLTGCATNQSTVLVTVDHSFPTSNLK